MKNCSACGMANADEAAFCISCGEALGGPETLPVPAEEAPGPVSEGYYRPATVSRPDLEPVAFVGFGQAIRSFFKNYARFKGRATRAEFWFAYLFMLLVEYGVALLFVPILWGTMIGMGVSEAPVELLSQALLVIMLVLYGLLLIITVVLFVPMLAVIWRRLHDLGVSGANYFIGMVPLVGPILLIVWLCMASDGDNKYGPRRTAEVLAAEQAGE